MKLKRSLIALFALLGSLTAFELQAAEEHSLPAVQGYDVVSYHELKRPVRGSGHFTSTYNNATYLFATETNKSVFDENPERYVPAYNGYCAFGVSVGKKFIADPEVWRIVDGKLYLNLDSSIQDAWLKDIPGRIKSADDIWKNIEHTSPAAL